MISNSKLYRDSFFAILSSVSRMLLAFISVPITIDYLGSERYGIWAIALSFISIINLLDAGITPTLKNKMTAASTYKSDSEFRTIFRTGLYFNTILFAILIFSLFPLWLIDWGWIFNINGATLSGEVRDLMLMTAFIAIFSLMLANVESYFAAKMRLGELKLWDAGFNLAAIVAIYYCVRINISMPALALIYASPVMIARGIFLGILMKGDISLFLVRKSDLKLLRNELLAAIRKGSSFLGVQACEALISFAPTLIIAHLLSLNEVTRYTVVYKVMSLPLLAISAVLPIIWPSFTVAWQKNHRSWISGKLKAFSSGSIVVYLCFCVVIYLAGPHIIQFWTKGVVTPTYSELFLAGFCVLVLAVTYWLSTFLHSISDFRFEFFSHLAIVISICVLGTLALHYGGISLLFAAIGVSWFSFGFLPMLIRVQKILGGNT